MHTLLKDKNPSYKQTVLALLRHGKTLWNEEKRIQGRHNSVLSPDGIAQVHKWGKFLGQYSIDRIISSDLDRVKETVAIVQEYLHDVPAEYTSVLREQSWGDWEGMTFPELHKHHEEDLNRQIQSGWEFCPPGGESRREVLERTLPFLQSIMARFPGERILVVSHEGIIKSILYHLAGRAFMPEEKKLIQKRQLHLLYDKQGELALGPLNIFPTDGSR